MTQRLVAAAIAVPAILALLVFAVVARLPYAYYAPGGTLDVLGTDSDDAEIIQIDGHPVYRDDGNLRMTTVSVSPAQLPDDRGLDVFTVLSRWFDSEDAVYPYLAVHPDDATPQSSDAEGQRQMATSQDTAVEVGLTEAGITVPEVVRVDELTPDLPAEKKLKSGDRIISIEGTRIDDADTVLDVIGKAEPGEPLTFVVERDGERRTVDIAPVQTDDGPKVGFTPGIDYDFPFDVRIRIDPTIGGPSAGLIFSLAVYDTITPGSLTGGHDVAGTGEIFPDGSVGPIGGIEQKIAGARRDGAELFLVPEDNCADALEADNGDMRLMRASTMHEVRLALEKYAENPDVDLPSCEDVA